MYFTTNANNNDILDPAEQATILILFKDSERPSALDISRMELIPSTGSALTVERSIPPVSDTVLKLD
jgi:hypothetical protein